MTTPTGWDHPDSRDPTPDTAVIGVLALLFAISSVICAVTFFFTPFAYLGAAVALALGALTRGDDRSRTLGTAAVVIAIGAVLCATVALFSVG